MRQHIKRIINRMAGKLGYKVVRLNGSLISEKYSWPVEFSSEDIAIVDYVISNQLTMVSRERLYATLLACKYVESARVAGDFVECGVWRGGNSIVAADVFSRGATPRKIYLFDTFLGMTRPTDKDFRASDGLDAMAEYLSHKKENHNEWCYASLPDVKSNLAAVNTGKLDVKFIQGDVVESLRDETNLPASVSVLRLDTDWYESTLAELEILYPRLSNGGVLIIDDYGHWGGARKAVDEYFNDRPRPLLQYTDYTGRMGVKR